MFCFDFLCLVKTDFTKGQLISKANFEVRQAIEDHIYGNHDKPSVVYPQTQERIKHYLDEAKELTDVIDFHQPESQSQIE